MRLARKRGAGEACEGAIINTGGGMAGGDRLSISVEAGCSIECRLSDADGRAHLPFERGGYGSRHRFAARRGSAARLASARDDPLSRRASAHGASMSRWTKALPSSSPRRRSSDGSPWVRRPGAGCSPIAGASGEAVASCKPRRPSSRVRSDVSSGGPPSGAARAPWQMFSSSPRWRRTGSTRRDRHSLTPPANAGRAPGTACWLHDSSHRTRPICVPRWCVSCLPSRRRTCRAYGPATTTSR